MRDARDEMRETRCEIQESRNKTLLIVVKKIDLERRIQNALIDEGHLRIETRVKIVKNLGDLSWLVADLKTVGQFEICQV